MGKTALWLAFVVWISWWPAWGQAERQPRHVEKPADAKTTQSYDGQRGTKDSPIFVQIQSPQSKADTTKAEKDNQKKELYDLITASSAGLAALFTGLLVIVGYCGVRAAVRTLRAIEKQAHLMEIQFDQWVTLTNWRTQEPRENTLQAKVDLVNETSFPMTLNERHLRFGHGADPIAGTCTKYLIGKGVF